MNMNSKNTMKTLFLAGVLAVGLASVANAAVFIKIKGVPGDVTGAQWSGENALYLTTEEDPVAVGLLLPAVQSAREAARRPRTQGRAKSFSELEVSDGGKNWTLYDATATPDGPNRVKIDFRCKDWTDLRSGETGSDCASADGSKGGKVEPTWKLEKGKK